MAHGRHALPAYIKLTIITLIAGLMLGITNDLTEQPIKEQAALASERARAGVFAQADEFIPFDVSPDAGIDWCYEARAGGETRGYVAQKTVSGYGGEIEIIVGVDMDVRVTGVSIGGANFAETPSLGAKAKDARFASQFEGKRVDVLNGVKAIKAGDARDENSVDAVTSATITSRAVVNGVNDIGRYLELLMYPEREGLKPSDAHTGATTSKSPDAQGDEGGAQ